MSDQPKRSIEDFKCGEKWLLLGKEVVVTYVRFEEDEELRTFSNPAFVSVMWWAGDELKEKSIYEPQLDLLQPLPRRDVSIHDLLSKKEFPYPIIKTENETE